MKKISQGHKNRGFPKFIHKGKWNNYNYYIMEMLGNSLKLVKNIISKFTLENILMLSIQLINRLEVIHDYGYVHRDIKPANLMFGNGRMYNTLYVIDFGLAKRVSGYKHSEIPDCIFEPNNVSLSGTPNYASINLHWGWEECFRKDDIESAMYMLIHLLVGNLYSEVLGSLPWEHIQVDDQFYT